MIPLIIAVAQFKAAMLGGVMMAMAMSDNGNIGLLEPKAAKQALQVEMTCNGNYA